MSIFSAFSYSWQLSTSMITDKTPDNLVVKSRVCTRRHYGKHSSKTARKPVAPKPCDLSTQSRVHPYHHQNTGRDLLWLTCETMSGVAVLVPWLALVSCLQATANHDSQASIRLIQLEMVRESKVHHSPAQSHCKFTYHWCSRTWNFCWGLLHQIHDMPSSVPRSTMSALRLDYLQCC